MLRTIIEYHVEEAASCCECDSKSHWIEPFELLEQIEANEAAQDHYSEFD